ncbi:hypothetical protein V6Z12_D12G071600 [Gossypium hirsutum]
MPPLSFSIPICFFMLVLAWSCTLSLLSQPTKTSIFIVLSKHTDKKHISSHYTSGNM